jgi:signal peptidase I
MKKKFKKPILIFGIGILILLATARLTNILQFYRVPTPNNEPAIKQGAYIFATNIIAPQKRDFICYNTYDELSQKEEVYVQRLCGTGGDRVEIVDGVLFVNGENFDKDLALNFQFVVSKKDYTTLKAKKLVSNLYPVDSETVVVFTDSATLAKENIEAVRFINTNDITANASEYVKETYKKEWGKNSWTIDNFGPVTVPKEHYFVLGDSRNNSLDSRYLGFIPTEKFVGTVIYQ